MKVFTQALSLHSPFPPPLSSSSSPSLSQSKSTPFRLCISHIDNFVLPPLIIQHLLDILSQPPPSTEPVEISFQLNATFFDASEKRYFGSTWTANLGYLEVDSLLDPDIAQSSKAEYIGVVRNGRLFLDVNDFQLNFHTSLHCPAVYIILEFSVLVSAHCSTSESYQQELSLAWSAVNLFDPALGGLTLSPAGSVGQEAGQRTEIFQGSCRCLLVLPISINSFLEVPEDSLKPIPEASISYTLSTDFSIESFTHLFSECTIISKLDSVPGLSLSPNRDWHLTPTIEPTFTDFSILVYPNLQVYEEKLSKAMLVNRYYTHNSKPPVDAPLPTILERRLHVCLHNSYTFISAPTVINLRPLTRSNIPIGLHVSGDLKLDGWIQGGDKMLKLVIWVEYRFGFGIGEDGMDKREESVILGWKVCDTDSDRLAGLTQSVLLDCSPFPFAKSPMVFRYKPDVHEHNDTIEADGLFISRQDPFIALFRIHDVEVPKVSSSIESKRVSLSTDNPFADPTPSEEEVHLQAKPESKRSISTSHADSIHASNASSTEDLRECPVPSVDQEFNLRHVQRDTFPISSKHPLTRAQRARLISAGFPTRVDEDGRGLVQVSNDNEPFIRDWNWKIELNDEYVGNEITICLMGLSIFEEEKSRATAKSVYFNYRFFTRESQTSGIFYLYRGSTNQPITQAADDNRDETEPNEWPAIFFPIERRKGEIALHKPGYTSTHLLSPSSPVSSPSSPSTKIPSSIHFIATKFVQIDIYDADSLLHLGYCRIPLKSMLRQGRKGVELFSEADIVCEMGSKNPTHLVIGQLYYSIANVGKKIPGVESWNQLMKDMPMRQFQVENYRSRLKKKIGNPENTRFSVVGQLMTHVDNELKKLLESKYCHGARHISLDDIIPHKNLSPDITRRLERVHNVRECVTGSNNSSVSKSENITYQEKRTRKIKDLSLIHAFRDRRKPIAIRNALNERITSTLDLHVSPGASSYFEFNFTNPFSFQTCFEIILDDPNFRIINDKQEWTYLRQLYLSNLLCQHLKISENQCQLIRPNTYQLYMHGYETVAIPVVYQCFEEFSRQESYRMERNERKLRRMKIMTIPSLPHHTPNPLDKTHIPAAILEITIRPQSYFVDRSFIFLNAENEYFRKTIPFIKEGSGDELGAHATKKYIRSSTPEVECLGVGYENSNLNDVTLQYWCGRAGEQKSFHFLVYGDKYCHCLEEIWEVNVTACQRIEVTCVLGQDSAASLILRGMNCAKTVQAFVNVSDNIEIIPNQPFILEPNVLSELKLKVKPTKLGNEEVIVNVVDVEHRTLVATYLINLSCQLPSITKSFDVQIPLQKASKKRVTYTNPYPLRKIFYLKSTNEAILSFKESKIHLDAGATQYIGLKFAVMPTPLHCNVLVMILDEQEKVEECLEVRVRYG